jgi:glycerol-3-phosphate acyltransferase PlsY
MLLDAALIAFAYAVGSIPVAYLVARAGAGIDLRQHGSGNAGASNVYQSVSKRLVVPVGLAQIAQGLAPLLLARAADAGDGVLALCGIAAVAANNWNPWLRLNGGRGIGTTIGVLLALSPGALAVFIVVALGGVALRAIPQGVLLALVAAPAGAIVMEQSGAVVAACAALAALAAAKRLTANGPPDASCERPAVYLHRLLYDRDIRDRDAWVRRSGSQGSGVGP